MHHVIGSLFKRGAKYLLVEGKMMAVNVDFMFTHCCHQWNKGAKATFNEEEQKVLISAYKRYDLIFSNGSWISMRKKMFTTIN